MRKCKYHAISLPCKTYIRKYAEAIFGKAIKADSRTSFGCLIQACLDKNIYSNRHISDNFIYRDVTDKITIVVNSWQFQALGFDFSDEKVLDLNRFLENLFEEDLYRYCQLHIVSDKRYKGYAEAIEQFCEKHNIVLEHDITFDAIKKIEYRKRKRQEDIQAADNAKIATLFCHN